MAAGGLDAARALLAGAVRERVFPAAVAELGNSRDVVWVEPFGTLTFDDEAAPATDRTIFDLASLTKPIATATLVMNRVAAGRLALDQRVADLVADWRTSDRESVTVRDLLEHASGLPARLIDRPPESGRESGREFLREICRVPLEYPPRSRSIYSDLDFILLALIVEEPLMLAGEGSFEDVFSRDVGVRAGDFLAFGVPGPERGRTAPTWPLESDWRHGRLLFGEVHDEYAARLGGVAGHAGLFGTAGAVGRFAQMMLRAARADVLPGDLFTPAEAALLTRKTTVAGSSRALGWDTMLVTSSCGTELSPAAFGHVGFTGTSLWIDPVLDRYFVLLTNRVCRGGGTEAQIRAVRRAFHDALAHL